MATPKASQPDPTVITDHDVTDGQAAAQRTYGDTRLGETIAVDGYGLILRVSRGELEIVDGANGVRRTRRIPRARAAAGQVRRILVLGTGTITTEATAWCHALNIALIVAGPQGELLSIGAPGLYDDAGLRRAQALAPFTVVGMTVARQLLTLRVNDQARITRHLLHRDDRASAIEESLPPLAQAGTPADAMNAEMRAAGHYWAAWADEVTLRFASKDRTRVPQRWTRFDARTSPLSEAFTNRHAASPVNALINYGTRLAEMEATLCCRALGLDPGMGLLHSTGLNRPAMVLDLIEPARSVIEEAVLGMARERTFRKADFAELPSGQVRLLAPLSHHFASALLPTLRERLGPIVEQAAQTIATVATKDVNVPTTLSRARNRTGAPKRSRERRLPSPPTLQMWSCPDCGTPVTNSRRVRCDACIQKDPRQTPEIRGRRAKAIAARRRADAQWEVSGGEGSFDPDAWPDILDGLQTVKLADITAATGLSKSFASAVRSGKHRPHRSHWPALANLKQPTTKTDPASRPT